MLLPSVPPATRACRDSDLSAILAASGGLSSIAQIDERYNAAARLKDEAIAASDVSVLRAGAVPAMRARLLCC